MSVPPKGKRLPKTGNELHVVGRVSSAAYTSELAKALRLELGGSHRAAKTIMKWTGASERTAKGWLAGTSGPSGEHLVALMANSDAVLVSVLKLAARPTGAHQMRLEALKVALGGVIAAIEALPQTPNWGGR